MSSQLSAQTIAFARPWITDSDREAVLEVLKRDVLTHGPEGKHFEEEFSAYVGPNAHSVSLSSGMAALHLAYWQLGIGAGDEVIVPAQTHVATVHAVEYLGAKPIFVDCLPETGNIDPKLIEKNITPRTKAIALVHFLGIPCDMDAILAIAQKHKLFVVEDCAIALGSRYKGTHVGLLGDAGAFSFYPVKHMTTGDGGMLISRHADVADRVRKARGFGVDRTFAERSIPGMYDVPTLGLNYRMSDINSALGRCQLKRMPEILQKRRAHFDYLKNGFKNLPNVRVLDAIEKPNTHSFYCLSLVLEKSLAPKRVEFVKKLNALGVGTSVYYPQPVPRLTYYKNKYGYNPSAYPNATEISDASIALPVGPHLSQANLEQIVQSVQQTIKEVSL